MASMPTTSAQASPLTMNAHPAPTASSSTPAIAGPIMPPSWNTDELMLIALRRFFCPTSSVTITWRAGLSMTVTRPVRKAMPQTM